jgi:hypothetical protein
MEQDGTCNVVFALELALHRRRSHLFHVFVWYKGPDEGRTKQDFILRFHLPADVR